MPPIRSESQTPSPTRPKASSSTAWTGEELQTMMLYLIGKNVVTLSKADVERLQELLPGRSPDSVRHTWKNRIKQQSAELQIGAASAPPPKKRAIKKSSPEAASGVKNE